ncbi:MAG: serine hydrolase [Candidatus Velthaea sp.]
MIGPAEVSLWAERAGLAGAAVYLARLDAPGPVLAIDGGATIYPASMIKTPLAVAAAAAEAAGRLRWGDRVSVSAANLTVNDAPSPMQAGYVATIAELVDVMLARSDNVATNVLIDVLGRERATADLAALGFPETRVRRKLSGAFPLIDDPEATGRNTHSARDAAELFRRLAHDDLPGALILRNVLQGQYWNAKLPSGLDAGDRFAHKTGDTDEVSHDGGILTLSTGARFVLVVYTSLPSTDQNDRRFGEFMRMLRPHLAGE